MKLAAVAPKLARMRRTVALCALGFFLLATLSRTLAPYLMPWSAWSQPGLMLIACAGGAGVFYLIVTAIHFLIALCCGRIVCSWICPIGTTQDIWARLTRRLSRRQTEYVEDKALNYVVPGLIIASLFAGGTWLYSRVGPWAIFSRVTESVGLPLAAMLNNAVSRIGELTGLYALSPTEHLFEARDTVLAMPIFVVILILVVVGTGGRTWCNSICPVGAMLGALGAHAFVRPRIVASQCERCGECERVCKAACIKAGERIDSNRCVACFNCIEACPGHAITLLPPRIPLKGYSPDRALVLRGAAAMAGVLVLSPFAAKGERRVRVPYPALRQPERPAIKHQILPPGAFDIERYQSLCTGCRSCITVCPTQVLVVSGPLRWNSGNVLRMALPILDFKRAFCQHGCTACTHVCPTGALQPISLEEKKRLQIGQAIFTRTMCIAFKEGTNCAACAEHCPTGAIRMMPRPDGPALPEVEQDLCTGCGACEYACPVRTPCGRTSIEVFGTVRHGMARVEGIAHPRDIWAGDEIPF